MNMELKVGNTYEYHIGDETINCHISDVNDRKVTITFPRTGNKYTMSLRRFNSDMNYIKTLVSYATNN